jgi:hypothetical protein
MFSFTAIFIALAVLALIVIFGVTYILKGLKVALVTTGIAFLGAAILFAGLIFVIVNSMPN